MNGGGYSNGYGSSGTAGGYGDYSSPSQGYTQPTNGYSNRPTWDSARSRDRRPAGYGGLGPDPRSTDRPPQPQQQSQTQSPADPERRRPNRLSAGPSWAKPSSRSRSHSRNRASEGRAAQQIDQVLQYVKRDWSFMTEDKCIPVQTALQLLDPSSLGLAHRYDEFQDAQRQLQDALRGIVNEHHQGFNSSIGTFHQIQASIQSSYQRIRTLKQSLVDAKSNLTSTKPEFNSLIKSSHNYESMLDVLANIERLQQIPEQLESKISEKRFIVAVELLQEGLRLTRNSQLDNVAALADMNVYISNQDHSLTDILIEELHNHLYLKSPYCENRWTTYTKVYGQSAEVDRIEQTTSSLYDFLDRLDTSEPMIEDASRNPEADSFHYIYTIVESLSKLGRLDEAVEAIEQRLPVELFKVVERSNTEVQQRHPNSARPDWRKSKGGLDFALDNSHREKVVNDLLATLYAKFEAIAESYRALHEVTRGVALREESYNTKKLTRSFRELWKLYQSEIRSLLHDYLAADDSAAQRLGQLSGEENVFRQQRDKSKKCTFKMEWVDATDSELRPECDEVIATWQKFVPGMASLPSHANGSSTNPNGGQNPGSGTGHKLLVEPSVFNITCLLPASVIFLRRLKELVPPTSDIVISTLSSFLNEFLINVFQPQLEETLTDFCSQSFVQIEAFQQDPQWRQHSQKPIFKGVVNFVEIITAFCRMLAGLTHDQLFSQLVITQMNNYYDRCGGWYKALVSRAQATSSGRIVKASALFAEGGGDISDTVTKIWDQEDGGNIGDLVQQETLQLIYTTKNHPLEEADLLVDRKTHGALCLLYTSMKWIAGRLANLRFISPRATDATGMDDSEQPRLKRSLTAALVSSSHEQEAKPAYLPLSHGTASLFDGIIGAYEDLAALSLRTLHLELRCHAIQSLGQSFRGSLLYLHPAEAPHENMMRLVTDMLDFNQEISNHLQSREYRFITTGTSHLIDTLVVHCTVQNVTGMNEYGSAHMQLNTRVLYHNLINIEPNCDLPRSTAFFALFDKGPDAIVAAARDTPDVVFSKFDRRDLEAMLKLSFSEAVESPSREDAMRAKKALDDKLNEFNNVGTRSGGGKSEGPGAPSIFSFNSSLPGGYSTETASLASTAPPSYLSRHGGDPA